MPTVKRVYRSESRKESAEQTKKNVLSAARELFTELGFEKTTVAGIAVRAGVSAPMVYALYKSKEGMLAELVRGAAFGEGYRALVEKVLTDPDPLECLRTAAAITRHVCEAERSAVGLIRGASLLSPELGRLETEGEAIRYERQQVLVKRLFDANVVEPGIDFERARDILWGLTSRDMYRMMVFERGWPPEEYEAWLGSLLIRSIVREDAR